MSATEKSRFGSSLKRRIDCISICSTLALVIAINFHAGSYNNVDHDTMFYVIMGCSYLAACGFILIYCRRVTCE